jgi:hypothetical protein
MSHFTTIKTQLRDTDALLAALKDLGFHQVECYATPQVLIGYEGDRRSESAEVIIRRRFISPLSNDIGFARQADGSFHAIISEYDQRHGYDQTWLDRLVQRYGYHHLKVTADREGFTIEAEETLEDGTIRLVVGRWR